MEKQSKLNKFLKPLAAGVDIFESSEFDIESGDNRGSLGDKKQPNLMNFLRKIDQLAIDIMEKYVADHKFMLDIPQRNKITLFEDVYIICEYRKSLQALKKDRTKVVDAIIQKLHGILKRSKVTIKERMSKKLSRCTVEDVLQAIKNKKDIVFDKEKEKSKKTAVVANEDADEAQGKPQVSVKSEPTNEHVKPENETKTEEIKKEKDTKLESIYKYGTQKIKERIYIYGNIGKSLVLNFPESRFEEMKHKLNIDLPLIPKKTEDSNQILEEKSESIIENASKPQADQPSLSEEDLKTLIEAVKEKAAIVLSQCNETQSGQKQEEVKNYLQKIRLLQEKLTTSQSTTKDKTFDSDISDQVSVQRQNKKRSGEKTTGKKTSASSPQKDTTQKEEQNKKLLFKLCNNVQHLEMLKNDPSLIKEYMWEEQEDNILFSFKFSPQVYQTDMICLLRYKPRSLIIERMKFLSIEVNFSLIEQINHLDHLENKKLEKVELNEIMEAE